MRGRRNREIVAISEAAVGWAVAEPNTVTENHVSALFFRLGRTGGEPGKFGRVASRGAYVSEVRNCRLRMRMADFVSEVYNCRPNDRPADARASKP